MGSKFPVTPRMGAVTPRARMAWVASRPAMLGCGGEGGGVEGWRGGGVAGWRGGGVEG